MDPFEASAVRLHLASEGPKPYTTQIGCKDSTADCQPNPSLLPAQSKSGVATGISTGMRPATSTQHPTTFQRKLLSTMQRKFWLRFNPPWIQRQLISWLVAEASVLRYLEGLLRLICVILNVAFVVYNMTSSFWLDRNSFTLLPGLFEFTLVQVW